jgi:hypothetical protein
MSQPRPEHPRPDLFRPDWLSLNGPWRFAFDPRNVGEHERWYAGGRVTGREIQVPFPWESRLSGVEAPDYMGAAWYEREIELPAAWRGRRVFLHFGAVDWSARVWLNGRFLAEHENGYLPFSCELTNLLQAGEGARLTVRAYDVADAATLVGKQVPRWYNRSSGIWQSVWLEARASAHVEVLRITPHAAEHRALIRARISTVEAGDHVLRLRSPDGSFPTIERPLRLDAGTHEVSLTLDVHDPRLWSPDSPHLYDLAVELGEDHLSTYFGLRDVARGAWDGREYEYVLLNGEPIYLRGALDQAFHPDGIYAYPSDDAIRADVQLAKDVGLNMLRCHIKPNDPRYYYWADRLGVLVMHDLPNAMIDTPAVRRTFEETLPALIERDGSHPSVIAWVLFNETWGLTRHDTEDGRRWVQSLYRQARDLDPSRLVEDNSPCNYDHVESDLNSWHFYINDWERARRHVQRVVDETEPGSGFNYVDGEWVQGRAPLLNSEYAGISARMGDLDVSWSFKFLTTDLRRHDKICGYVYTELTDVEWEHNGFVNYDRTAKEFGYDAFVPGMMLRDLTGADFVGLDAPPCQTLPPGATFAAPLFVSNWGPPIDGARVRWRVQHVDRLGRPTTSDHGLVDAPLRRFGVTDLGELRVALPREAGLATIQLLLEDAAGEVRCRNYVNVELGGGPSPRAARTGSSWMLRLTPGDYARSSWPQPQIGPAGAKFGGLGIGWVEYELALPPEMTAVRGGRLLLETGTRAGMGKVDWRERAQGGDYPQTEARKWPGQLVASLDGVPVGTVELADDPADARGVLSHHRGYNPGSYGQLVDLELPPAALERLRAGQRVALRLEATNGLSLYGETLGAYPVDPALILDTE